MRQIWIPKAGPPEVLEIREAADPEPKRGEVRIRVEAAGVNFADIVARLGIYPDLPPMPVVAIPMEAAKSAAPRLIASRRGVAAAISST